MKSVQMSQFLTNNREKLKELIELLSEDYSYVSILGTDVVGKRFNVQKTGISIEDSDWSERGFVLRVYNGINYSEFSFNEIPEDLNKLVKSVNAIGQDDINSFKNRSMKVCKLPIIEEKMENRTYFGEVEILPSEVSSKEKVEKLIEIQRNAFNYCDKLIDFRVSYQEVQVSKLFISNKKDLEQSYIWSEGYSVPMVRSGENVEVSYNSFSGLKGVELIREMENGYKKVIDEVISLLDAERIVPGEYDVICTPEIAGLIAHEAFGHGVEMDMFVKKRAKAEEFINKEVASKLVTMHDGAASAKNVSSYLFDDEGVIGTDTVIIDKGILKTGICDTISALRLGVPPTGNGKRESFERKAYSRMTNTFFQSGNSKVEDMISSIKFGYLLDGTMSGMEDPKNWGIQCLLLLGKEIVDGKLTGKIVSPVVMTGYVPDLLKSISMVSEDVELFGSGGCGKGYKEWVKVSDGGPYIKAKARLG